MDVTVRLKKQMKKYNSKTILIQMCIRDSHKGVILTTGGFGANVDMRMEYDTHWKTLDASIPTTNSPAIVGDGIVMARDIGANLVGMEDIQLYPVNNPATGNYYFMDYARINANALLLNQEG